jgi:hypothetical protein
MNTAADFLTDILALVEKHKSLKPDVKITLLKTAVKTYKDQKKLETFLKKTIGKISVQHYKETLN